MSEWHGCDCGGQHVPERGKRVWCIDCSEYCSIDAPCEVIDLRQQIAERDRTIAALADALEFFEKEHRPRLTKRARRLVHKRGEPACLGCQMMHSLFFGVEHAEVIQRSREAK